MNSNWLQKFKLLEFFLKIKIKIREENGIDQHRLIGNKDDCPIYINMTSTKIL